MYTPVWFDVFVIIGIAVILYFHINLKNVLKKIEKALSGKK